MAYRDVVLADAPVGYWRLEDDLTDESPNGNNGSMGQGALDYVAGLLAEGGRAGSLLTTDPQGFTTGDAINVSSVADNIPVGTTSFTYETWASRDSAWPDSFQYFIDTNERRILAFKNREFGTIAYYDGGTWRDFGVAFPTDGVAHHVVLTVEGTQAHLYLDGVRYTVSCTQADLGSSTTFMIGAKFDLTALFIDEVILDEAAIYDRALTQVEVTEHYDAGLTVPNEPPSTPTCAVDAFTDLSVDLSSSAYSDPDGDPHAASQWQVDAAAGDFSTPVHDSSEDAVNLTSYSSGDVLTELTDYIARVRHKDDQGAWSNWSASVAFTTEASNVAPDQPSITGADVTVDRNEQSVELTSSAFSDPDAGDTHAASRWQVRRASDADWTSPFYDSGTDAVNLVAITVTDLPLDDLLARVQHQDAAGEWSAWSAAEAFSTIRFVQVARPGGSFVAVPRPDPQSYEQIVVADGPSAYYRFDEDAVTEAVTDSSGNGYDGTYQTGSLGVDNCSSDNVPSFATAGPSGGPALTLSGPDSRARAAGLPIPVLNVPFTVEFWAKPTAICNHTAGLTTPNHIEEMDRVLLMDIFVDPNRGFGCALGTDELYALHFGPNDVGGVQLYAGDLSGWHHFVFLIEAGQKLTFYLDKVSQGVFNPSGMDVGEEWTLAGPWLGKRYAAFDDCNVQPEPYLGSIAELACSDRLLTAADIEEHYDNIGILTAAFTARPRPGGSFVEAP